MLLDELEFLSWTTLQSIDEIFWIALLTELINDELLVSMGNSDSFYRVGGGRDRVGWSGVGWSGIRGGGEERMCIPRSKANLFDVPTTLHLRGDGVE